MVRRAKEDLRGEAGTLAVVGMPVARARVRNGSAERRSGAGGRRVPPECCVERRTRAGAAVIAKPCRGKVVTLVGRHGVSRQTARSVVTLAATAHAGHAARQACVSMTMVSRPSR